MRCGVRDFASKALTLAGAAAFLAGAAFLGAAAFLAGAALEAAFLGAAAFLVAVCNDWRQCVARSCEKLSP